MSKHNANKELDRMARRELRTLRRYCLIQRNRYAENIGLPVNIRGLEQWKIPAAHTSLRRPLQNMAR
jgi:hypothetical protein